MTQRGCRDDVERVQGWREGAEMTGAEGVKFYYIPSMSQDSFIGMVAGKCRLLERIGEGGTAYVYRAHNEAFQMDRVVKVLKRELSQDEDFFPKFQQEAQLVARLDHPNILRVFDTGLFEDHFYIEMDFIRGMTLRDFQLRHKRIPEKVILNIAVQIARALRYAHEAELTTPDGIKVHGILHLDLKPENIMITPNLEVKLMDFGAAKMLVGPDTAGSERAFGTPSYMSPEQVTGHKLDVKSDYFSLGAILYEMYAGRKAFEGNTPEDIMRLVIDADCKPLRSIRRSILPWSEDLIERLLSAKPSHRPSTAAEIESDLNLCAHLFQAWGTGARMHVPFEIRKHVPMIALALALLAFCFSTAAFVQSCDAKTTHHQSAKSR